MITIGLTGSIGMGKSTVAAMFGEAGMPVFDADAAVHRLQGPTGRIVAAIEAAFPSATDIQGVKRSALGDMVLGDTAALRRLEAIVHPAIAEERARFLAEHAGAPIVLLDVPLLFETGGDRHVDKVVVVSAAPDVQRARVLARPGMTPARLDAILARQTSDVEKRARADFIITTDLPLAETRAAVHHLIACLGNGKGG